MRMFMRIAMGCGVLWLAACGTSAPAGGNGPDGSAGLPFDASSDTAATADTATRNDAAAVSDTVASSDGGATSPATDAMADSGLTDSGDGSLSGDVQGDLGSADSGDSVSDSTPPATPVPLDKLAATAAQILCKANFTTCLPEDKLPFATEAGCIAAVQAADASVFADLIAMVEAGKLKYDPQQAAECLALAAATCDEIDLVDGPPACQAVFTGSLANGKPCKYNVECASHYCPDVDGCGTVCKKRIPKGSACADDDKCESGSVCFGGLCVADTPKGPGAACGEVKCAKGLYCSDKGKCTPLNKKGQPCDLAGSCESGLQCLLAGDAGQCQPLPKQSEPCSPSIFSDNSVLCAAGLTCFNDGGEAGTCEPQAALGAPCTNSSNCGGWDVHCVGAAGSKTCQLLSGKGGACQPGDLAVGEWGGCLAPYTCNKGTCTDLPKAGEACADDILAACAPDLMCDFFKNVCVPMPTLGEVCYGVCQAGFDCALDPDGIQGVCVKGACP